MHLCFVVWISSFVVYRSWKKLGLVRASAFSPVTVGDCLLMVCVVGLNPKDKVWLYGGFLVTANLS